MRFFKNLLFLFKYSGEISKRRFIAAGIDIILNTIEPFIYLVFPMFIINELTSEIISWNNVLFYIGLFIGCILVFRSLRIIFNVFINMSVNRCDVKNGLFYTRHFLKMDYDKLEDGAIRDKQQKVNSNVRENGFIDVLSGFLTSLFKLIGFSYIVALLDPIVLVFIFMIIVINYFINRKLSKIDYEYQPSLAKFTRIFDYLFTAMTTFDYAKEVRVNNVNSILNKKFNNTLDRFSADNKRFLFKQMLINILVAVISFIQMLLSYGYVAYQAVIGVISVGAFSMYIGAIYNLSDAFNNVVAQCIKMKYLTKHVDDYHEYIMLAMPKNDENEINDLPIKNSDYPMFEFQNVSFVYPNTEKTVLDNISIKINEGEKLSIVGLNGAGKTTFIKLLCRLYFPTSGVIRYYGVDISTIKRDEYLKLLAVVFQDFKIFSFSFLDNIVLNQKIEEEKLNKAVENSGLKPKLQKLPNGIYTSIYKDFDEEGVEFSGGEGQKLVIARAYYKDAPLVILDEPTAALDALAEHEIYQNFNEITLDKTAIFISHRLASTRFCDSIAVFQDGKIVEYGDHDALLANKGLYADMFEKQALYYKTDAGAVK